MTSLASKIGQFHGLAVDVDGLDFVGRLAHHVHPGPAPDLKVGQLEHTVSGRHDEVRHDVNCLGQKPDLVLPRQQAERETALAARRISRCRNLQLTAIPVPPFLTDRGYLIQVLNCRVDTVNVVCERPRSGDPWVSLSRRRALRERA